MNKLKYIILKSLLLNSEIPLVVAMLLLNWRRDWNNSVGKKYRSYRISFRDIGVFSDRLVQKRRDSDLTNPNNIIRATINEVFRGKYPVKEFKVFCRYAERKIMPYNFNDDKASSWEEVYNFPFEESENS